MTVKMSNVRMKTATSRERDAIQAYLLQYGVDISVLEGTLVRIGKKVFLVRKEVFDVARDIERRKITPYALGVEIGTLTEEFEPSIQLADLLAGKTEEKTVINEEGEKLFSYGRDVFVQNILEGKERGNRIVVNRRGEVQGFGFFDGEMLRNVVDKGFYVRGKKGRSRW